MRPETGVKGVDLLGRLLSGGEMSICWRGADGKTLEGVTTDARKGRGVDGCVAKTWRRSERCGMCYEGLDVVRKVWNVVSGEELEVRSAAAAQVLPAHLCLDLPTGEAREVWMQDRLSYCSSSPQSTSICSPQGMFHMWVRPKWSLDGCVAGDGWSALKRVNRCDHNPPTHLAYTPAPPPATHESATHNISVFLFLHPTIWDVSGHLG